MTIISIQSPADTMFERLRAQTISWTPRRRRGAALQLVLGGVLMMVIPALLGDSGIAAGFRSLAPVAWLMAVAGAVLLLWPAEARGRHPNPESPRSGLVPLRPMPDRPSAPKAATKAAAAKSKAAPPRDDTAQPRFRDTELQFDDSSRL